MSEDRVVAELDVFTCRSLWGQTTKLCLLQYPLRPPWRPYELDENSKLELKPKAKRLALTVPLETGGDNYNEDVEDALKLKHLTLHSRPGQLETTHALGVIRGGRLLLMPIDEVQQMRPHMAHLDEPAARSVPEAVKQEAASEELALLTVQVQRRETERQAQMRLNSYAYLSKVEADEGWLDIKFRDLSRDESVWSKLENVPKNELPMDLSPREYLAALLPNSIASQQPDDDLKLAAAHRSAGDASTSAHLQKSSAPNRLSSKSAANHGKVKEEPVAEASPLLSAEELKELRKALNNLYRHGPVVSLRSIRAWLTSVKPHKALDRVAKGSDALLHSAVVQSDLSRQLDDFYVQIVTEDDDVGRFREITLELLAKKESVKRAEVVEACRSVKLNLSDAQCSKLLKELCQSRGALWFLRESNRS